MTGAEYKALRERIGWTQQELAWRLRLSISTIQKREQGRVPIDHEAAQALRSLAKSAE